MRRIMNLNDYGYNENQAFITVDAQKGTEYEKFGTVSIDNPLTIESFYNNAGKEVTINVLALPKKNKDDGGGVKETRVVCTYNVTSTDSTKICSATTNFASMEVDGTEVDVKNYYTFTTTGEHTVKFTLKDNTTISKNAFYQCTGLTSVVIPNSVTSIGNCAFQNCTSLTSVTIPDSVTSIGDNAFYNCTSLTSVTIPNSVTSIGNYAFQYCTILTSVTIGSGVTTIGNSAFNGCKSLTSVVIPNSVTSIGNCAFNGCAGLTSVTIGNGVTSIGDNAFSNCTSLTSVTIGSGITSIGSDAFYNTPWYKSYSADTANQYGNIVYINNVAYQATSTGITSCECKEGTVSIGGAAFSACTSLTSIVIPDSVTSIGDSAFNGCYKLTVDIPNSVTNIGDSAFFNCYSLTSVTIGSGVTSIGQQAFYNCTKLTSIKYNGTVAQWKAITRGTNWHKNVTAANVTCTGDGKEETCGLDDK